MQLPSFDNKRILITGGTGSLGKVLLKRILTGKNGCPSKITVFSRDESKQYALRAEYEQRKAPTHDILYDNFRSLIEFRIGDVRNLHSVASALRGVDIVFHTAALKQVPSCEYFPYEAVETNITGAENIVRAVRDYGLPVELVIGVSTDKAANPVNVMGMSKSIQERIFTRANLDVPDTRFIMVRYGNVLASRGSVIPLFREQIRAGGPITITHPDMTRFVLSLDQAVDCIFEAAVSASPGEIVVPRIRAARIMDVANALNRGHGVKKVVTGIRPGEKLHEVLVTEEEALRSRALQNYYLISPLLPELHDPKITLGEVKGAYSSDLDLMDEDAIELMLRDHQLLVSQDAAQGELEVLR